MLTAVIGDPIDDDEVDGISILGGRVLRAIEMSRLSIREGDTHLDRAALDALAIADFHVIRDLAARLDVVAHEPEELGCRNCDRTFSVDVADEVPPEHFATRFAKDAQDRARDGTTLPATLHMPEPLSLGRKRSSVLRLGPVTVSSAVPLWAAVWREQWAVSPAFVRAMGIVSAGDVRDPKLIARALDRASDRVWDALAYAFDVLHYPAALVVPYACEYCGARNDLETPQPRELDWSDEYPDVFAADPETRAEERAARRERHRSVADFPDAFSFERTVERIAEEVYRDKGVQNIALRVETGPASVDDGGEPLLGSYEPIPPNDAMPTTSPGAWEFLITIYYETFLRMHREEGPYDLDAELRDTIEHEVDHHLAFLRGDDPVDRQEREAIRNELIDTYGKNRLFHRFVADLLRRLLGTGSR